MWLRKYYPEEKKEEPVVHEKISKGEIAQLINHSLLVKKKTRELKRRSKRGRRHVGYDKKSKGIKLPVPLPGFEHVFASAPCSSMSEQQKVSMSLILSGRTCAVLGPAGTGKTYVIQQSIPAQKAAGKRVQFVSLVGQIARSTAGGVTVHSWQGLPIHFREPSFYVELIRSAREKKEMDIEKRDRDSVAKDDGGATLMKSALMRGGSRLEQMAERLCTPWQTIDVLYIDEVTLMDLDILKVMDAIARMARDNREVPFGGVQVVVLGDFTQRCFYDSRIHIEFPWWSAVFRYTVFITEPQRQNASDFKVMQELRMGKLSPESLDIINARVIPEAFAPGAVQGYLARNKGTVALVPYRRMAHSINEQCTRSSSSELPIKFFPLICMADGSGKIIRDASLPDVLVKIRNELGEVEPPEPKESAVLSMEDVSAFADHEEMNSSIADSIGRRNMEEFVRILASPSTEVNSEDGVTQLALLHHVKDNKMSASVNAPIGTQVVCTQNFNQKLGIVNGSTGIVIGVTIPGQGRAMKKSEKEALKFAIEQADGDSRNIQGLDSMMELEPDEAILATWDKSSKSIFRFAKSGMSSADMVRQFSQANKSRTEKTRHLNPDLIPMIVVMCDQGPIALPYLHEEIDIVGIKERKWKLCIDTVPVVVAYAMTIMRAQGATYARAMVDNRALQSSARPGAAYAAISRVKKLSGLVLSCPITNSDIKVNEAATVLVRVADKAKNDKFNVFHTSWLREQLQTWRRMKNGTEKKRYRSGRASGGGQDGQPELKTT